MQPQLDRKKARRRIRRRIRRKIAGTAQRPRLAVFRSLGHIYVQVIDDEDGRTIAHASTQSPDLRGKMQRAGNVDAAKLVGERIAEKLKQAGIETVVFDRGGFMFRGRVRALAEAARAGGLKF